MSLPVRLPAPSKANDNLISISTHPGAPMSHKPIKQEICDRKLELNKNLELSKVRSWSKAGSWNIFGSLNEFGSWN